MSIQITNLTYIYDRGTPYQKAALKDISLFIDSGSFIGLAGKTGSGKSTLAQNLDGLLIPTKGKISYSSGIVVDMTPRVTRNGKEKLKRPKRIKRWKELRKTIGIVFQFPEAQLFKNTVLSDVMVGPLNFKANASEAKTAAKQALKTVGLGPAFYQRSPFELSGGEKRKVALAGILAFKPKMLILDEPTVGLDWSSAQNLEKTLMDINRSGTTVLLITHYMDLVYRLCQRLLVMADGRVIADGKPIDIFGDEETMAKASLLPPEIFSYAECLRRKGLGLDLGKTATPEGLAKEIRRCL